MGSTHEMPEVPKPNLTPMIDVVFQLVIFFLVVNDLSRKEIVEVRLPESAQAQEHVPTESDLFVNVLLPADGDEDGALRLEVRGRTMDARSLERFLAAHVGGRPPQDRPSVVIRADDQAPWRHVQLVMQACAAERVAISHIQFATRSPDSK